MVSEIAELEAAIRPDEIGSPWAIERPGYFTDGGAPGPRPRRRSTSELAAGLRDAGPGGACGGGAAAAAPRLRRAAPVAAPGEPKRASGLFAAARAGQAGRRRAPASASADSALFLRAVAAEQPRAARRRARAAAAPARRPRSTSPASTAGYPGDDAAKEQIAAWMAKQAKHADCHHNCP